MERVAVFVDGSNLYYKLKDLSVPRSAAFDYRGLIERLAQGRSIVACGYYIGVVRARVGDAKAEQLKRNQVNLFNNLQAPSQGFTIHRGEIMENRGVFHEKGVDVRIAVNMLTGAYEDHYDTALLISSDTDLIPAIQQVRALSKAVEYIGFAHKWTYALRGEATSTHLITAADLVPFIAP